MHLICTLRAASAGHQGSFLKQTDVIHFSCFLKNCPVCYIDRMISDLLQIFCKHHRIDVFGKRINQDLLPVNVETTMCKISGFVGKPESARKKGALNVLLIMKKAIGRLRIIRN